MKTEVWHHFAWAIRLFIRLLWCEFSLSYSNFNSETTWMSFVCYAPSIGVWLSRLSDFVAEIDAFGSKFELLVLTRTSFYVPVNISSTILWRRGPTTRVDSYFAWKSCSQKAVDLLSCWHEVFSLPLFGLELVRLMSFNQSFKLLWKSHILLCSHQL